MAVAPLAGSVDRNPYGFFLLLSLPPVAPLAGSVDRNLQLWCGADDEGVAPLAGSVDRNAFRWPALRYTKVAPLAGSVDRNSCQQAGHDLSRGRSPRGERG